MTLFNRAIVLLLCALMVASVFTVTVPENVDAAQATSITPTGGRVGQPVTIHGSGLEGGGLKVSFGKAQATDVEVKNDKVAKVIVPNKDARDPKTVEVEILLDGIIIGEFSFDYRTHAPDPVIDVVNPGSAQVGLPTTLEIIGTDFTTPRGRVPDQIYLIGPEEIPGLIVGIPTSDSFNAEFPPVNIPGFYELRAGFSDAATTSAYDYEIF